MAPFKIFVALFAIACFIVTQTFAKPNAIKSAGSLVELPTKHDDSVKSSQKGNNDIKSSLDKHVAKSEAIEKPRSTVGALFPDDILDTWSGKKDGNKILGQTMDPFGGGGILKDLSQLNGIDSLEDLVEYIVSLVVPDVLKSLSEQPNEKSRSSKQHFRPRSSGKQIAIDAADQQNGANEGAPEPKNSKLGLIPSSKKHQPTGVNNNQEKLAKFSNGKATKTKSAGLDSMQRSFQGQVVDKQTLDLIVKLLTSLREDQLVEVLNRVHKYGGGGKSQLKEVKLRKPKRKESKGLKSKLGPQKLISDSINLGKENLKDHVKGSSASRAAKQTRLARP